VPLLLTRDHLFAGTHAFEGAVGSFLRVAGAFTNPADPRWRW
jgi:hypothetical protein